MAKIRTHKRYCTWTDETMWRKSAVESGLSYGVYDHVENKRVNVGICKTYNEAHVAAEKLNAGLENPYFF